MAFTPIRFTEEQRIFQEQMRRFADNEVAPIADEIDHEDRFPEEIIPKFGDLALLQWTVPEEYGGPDGSLTDLCIAREQIARHSLSLSVMVSENGNGMALPLRFAGSQAQKDKWYPLLARGRDGAQQRPAARQGRVGVHRRYRAARRDARQEEQEDGL